MAGASINGDGRYPSSDPWCSHSTAARPPCFSAHAHISGTAAYSATGGAPREGARISKRSVYTQLPGNLIFVHVRYVAFKIYVNVWSNTWRGRVVGMSSELSSPGAASTTYGIALTTRMAVTAMAARPAP